MNRREFLAVAGAVLAAVPLVACAGSSASPAPRRLQRVGVQLSTLTPLMLRDFEGTLALVAEIGYREVEFSAMGFLGREPERIRELLESNRLSAPQGRISPRLPDDFFTLPRDRQMAVFRERAKPEYLLENIENLIPAAKLLGHKSLVLPALMPDQFQTMAQVQATVELFSQAGGLCAAEGLQFGYHNHDWELAPIDGVRPYDLLLDHTDPAKVTFQLDTYWVRKAGGDLFDYLERYPGRFSSCHLKDIDADGNFEDVGHGLIDFPRFVREASARGAEHFFVERDNPPDPVQAVRRSFAYLNEMEF